MATATLYNEDVTQNKAQQLSTGQNLMKASLFNLIVVAQNPERAIHCQRLIEIVTEKFPCKIIFVRANPEEQNDFSKVSKTLQTVGKGSNQVLCDCVTIEVTQSQYHKIPFLVLPHIQPDMPVYLLLGDDPTQDKLILNELQKYVTRILFDPESIKNFHTFSRNILTLQTQTKADLVDLNWVRTRAWREIIAVAFKSQEALNQLNKSRMIQITYASPANSHQNSVKTSQTDIQAVYVQAWLASKLKWSLISVEQEAGSMRVAYKHDHSALTISLVPKDTGLIEPGAIYSFEVMTQSDYHYLISHENDNKLVKVHASNPERCEMPYTIFLNNYQNGPAMVSESIYQAPSEHYVSMLSSLGSAMWDHI